MSSACPEGRHGKIYKRSNVAGPKVAVIEDETGNPPASRPPQVSSWIYFWEAPGRRFTLHNIGDNICASESEGTSNSLAANRFFSDSSTVSFSATLLLLCRSAKCFLHGKQLAMPLSPDLTGTNLFFFTTVFVPFLSFTLSAFEQEEGWVVGWECEGKGTGPEAESHR